MQNILYSFLYKYVQKGCIGLRARLLNAVWV